jgi:hypothetical protein
LILPDAVFLNLFFDALCDFNFGIFFSSYTISKMIVSFI